MITSLRIGSDEAAALANVLYSSRMVPLDLLRNLGPVVDAFSFRQD